jgi:LuxR family maltose regulon positive regulatory protein
MTTPLLATKLFFPSPGTQLVSRPRLIEKLNQGLSRKLILISGPAGFGKSNSKDISLQAGRIGSTA